MVAQLGSKNIKAIVVTKGKAKKSYNNTDFMTLSRSVEKKIKENPTLEELRKHGTAET